MSKRGSNQLTQTHQNTTVEQGDTLEQQAAGQQEEQLDDVITQETAEGEKQLTATLEQNVEEDIALHEKLEVKAFTQQLDEYAARYIRKPAQPADDLAAHQKLHAAVRALVKASPKVQRMMFGAFVQRVSDSKNGEYQLPTIVKHLTNPKQIQDKGERVFLAEFLTLMSKYGRLNDKAQIHKEANVSRVFESISDKDVAKRLMDLFPSK